MSAPITIIALFLALTLCVGIYYGKRITNFTNYAIGDRQFTLPILVSTILATMYSAEIFRQIFDHTYRWGWFVFLCIFAKSMILWLIGYLAGKMGKYMGHLSMVHTIREIYGNSIGFVFALINIICSVVFIGWEMDEIINLFSYSLPEQYGTVYAIVTSLTLVLYSIFGGIRSVTFTDFVQLSVVSIILPILCCFVFFKVDLSTEAFIQQCKLYQNKVLTSTDALTLEGGQYSISKYMLLVMQLPIIQRIYMSSTPKQAKKAFTYAAFFYLIISSFIILLFFGVELKLSTWSIGSHYAKLLTIFPPILKGFFAIGLLSLGMSTIDSHLNTIAVVITHDMVPVAFRKLKLPKHPTKLARLVLITLGVATVYMRCLYSLPLFGNLWHPLIYLGDFCMYCCIPINTLLLLSMFWDLTPSKKSIAFGMGSIIGINLYWYSIHLYAPHLHIYVSSIIVGLFAIWLVYCFNSLSWDKGYFSLKHIKYKLLFFCIAHLRALSLFLKKLFRKKTLTKLHPSHTARLGFALYLTFTLWISWQHVSGPLWWYCTQWLAIMNLVLAPFYFPKCAPYYPGLLWLTTLILALPCHLLYCWLYTTQLPLLILLSFAHLGVALYLLPLRLGIAFIVGTLIMVIYPIVYCLNHTPLLDRASLLLPLLLSCNFLFGLLLYNKIKYIRLKGQLRYFKQQAKQPNLTPLITQPAILFNQISNMLSKDMAWDIGEDYRLYKQDFKAMSNLFEQWGQLLRSIPQKKPEQTGPITLTRLIRKVKKALLAECEELPMVEVTYPKNREQTIECDTKQIVQLIALAILRIVRLEEHGAAVHLSWYQTKCTFKTNSNQTAYHPALAIIMKHALIGDTPKIKNVYLAGPEAKYDPINPDFISHKMAAFVQMHQGCIEFYPNQTILVVLPENFNSWPNGIQQNSLPLDLFSDTTSATAYEMAHSLMKAMDYYDQLATLNGICPKTLGAIFLLLKRCYQNMKHGSGIPYYLRAIEITLLLSQWVPYTPNLIYAALIYHLVLYAKIPLSYVTMNFGPIVGQFVKNLIRMNHIEHKNQDGLENLFTTKETSTLFILWAERIHDLKQEEGFIQNHNQHLLEQLIHETKTIYLPIYQKCLYPEEQHLVQKMAEYLKNNAASLYISSIKQDVRT